jgi:sigma-B regulation protein RsbU (phosphoserine phosphatase)
MHVQQSLLPQVMPQLPDLQIAGRSRYCDATGGDYFDFVEVTGLPDGQVLLAVGDVMGHGIAAALLMATARAALRPEATHGGSLGTLMRTVNQVLARDARHERFMTMALVVVDARARRVRWASAGHDPVIVYDPALGTFSQLAEGKVVLGIDPGIEYTEYVREGLCSHCILFIGTDGIWEARNPEGQMYGKDRLREVIRAAGNGTAADISAALEDSLARYAAGCPLEDDVTFIVLKLSATPAGTGAQPAGDDADTNEYAGSNPKGTSRPPSNV